VARFIPHPGRRECCSETRPLTQHVFLIDTLSEMKFSHLFLVGVFAVCASAQVANNPLFNSPANVKARQLTLQAIAALGGQKYLTARYKSGSGRSYTFNTAGELDNPGILFWSFARFPDADRSELTKERDVVYLFNGDKGYQITFRGVQPVKPEQLRDHNDARDHSVDMVLRRWVTDPETLMIYKGIEMVDQRQVDSVDYTNGKGDTVTISYDINSHVPVREIWKRSDPEFPQPLVESATFGNYQVFEGVNTPMVVQRFEGDQRLSQRFYESASYAPLSDALFQPGPLGKQQKHR
jgi:hypothetical protein